MARRSTARPSPAWVGDLPVFERTLANGFKALVLPRQRAPVVVCDLYYPVGSFDEPPGKTGLAHFVEHMLFKGTERFPKGQIDRLALLARRAVQRRDRRGLHPLLVRLPVRPLGAGPGDRGRPDARGPVRPARGRGRAARHRRGAGPRPRFAPGPARPDPPGRHLPAPPLSQPDPGLARRPGADHRRRPAGVLPRALPARRRRARDRRRRRPRGGARPGRRPLRPMCRRATGRRPRPTIVEPGQTGRRDFTLVEPESVARGSSGWHTVPRGPSRRRRARRPLRPADLRPAVAALGRRWSRPDGSATWVDAAQEAAHRAGQFLLQVEAAPGVDTGAGRAADRGASCARLPDDGPTPEELARSRHRLEAAWRWEQEDLAGLAAGLGQVALWGDWRAWQAEHRAALAVEADDIRRVVSTYLDRRQPDGRLVVAPPRTAVRGRPDVGPTAADRRHGALRRRHRARPTAAGDRTGRSATHRSPLAMPGGDLAAGRLPPPPHRARQRPAAGLRAPAGHRESSRWSCSSTPACSARRSPAWPT